MIKLVNKYKKLLIVLCLVLITALGGLMVIITPKYMEVNKLNVTILPSVNHTVPWKILPQLCIETTHTEANGCLKQKRRRLDVININALR